jgi:predicted porin
MGGGYLDYQKGAWQWRASYAEIRFKNDLPLADLMSALNASGASRAANELSVADKVASFYSLGMAYDSGPIQLQLMLGRTQQESAAFEDASSGYLIAGYRISEVTPFAGYSWLKTEPRELATGVPNVGAGAVLNATVASVMADSHADQHTFILGARWDVYRNMALKAQLDLIRGTDKSIFPYRQEKPDFDGQMNVFSLAMDFIF